MTSMPVQSTISTTPAGGTGVGGSYARTGLLAAVSTTSYNANNQLTKWGSGKLTYDANSNLTSGGGNAYTWDARNQVTMITSGRTTIGSFSYDAFGRRCPAAFGKITSTRDLQDDQRESQLALKFYF